MLNCLTCLSVLCWVVWLSRSHMLRCITCLSLICWVLSLVSVSYVEMSHLSQCPVLSCLTCLNAVCCGEDRLQHHHTGDGPVTEPVSPCVSPSVVVVVLVVSVGSRQSRCSHVTLSLSDTMKCYHNIMWLSDISHTFKYAVAGKTTPLSNKTQHGKLWQTYSLSGWCETCS